MASFERGVARVTDEEERAYWEETDKGPQQQRYDTPLTTSPGKSNNQGFLSKLSGSEIGSACENLTKNIGGQAKNLGEQAKTFGEQAKGYTMANTSTAAAAMNRFKKQIVAAVDGVPLSRDEDQLRESGTASAGKEKGRGEDGDDQAEKEGVKNGQRHGSAVEEEEEKEEEEEQKEASACFSAAAIPKKAAGANNGKRNQVNGGMVDEGGPMLGLGALVAAFKKKSTGGATSTPDRPVHGVASGTSSSETATIPPSSSAEPTSGAGGGHQGGEGQSGGDDGAGALKIIPRTASLVGGRQWAVLASVYDTTASVLDETIGDILA